MILCRNPRVPCHSMPQIDLSAWRENVVQGCTIGGKHTGVGESAFPSPCTSCICTNDGVSWATNSLVTFTNPCFVSATMRIPENHRLLSIGTWMATWCDSERRRVQCPVRTCSPKHFVEGCRWLATTATESATLQTSLHFQLPRLQVPRSDAVRRISNS